MPRRWSNPEQKRLPLLERAAPLAVLSALRQRGADGMTRDELAAVAPLQTVCPVVLDLIRAGQVQETSRTRLTRAGKPAKVLVAAGNAPPSQTGDLVPRQLPAKPHTRGEILAKSAEENTRRLRAIAAAEAVILSGRRGGKSDEQIKTELALRGLEWPQ